MSLAAVLALSKHSVTLKLLPAIIPFTHKPHQGRVLLFGKAGKHLQHSQSFVRSLNRRDMLSWVSEVAV